MLSDNQRKQPLKPQTVIIKEKSSLKTRKPTRFQPGTNRQVDQELVPLPSTSFKTSGNRSDEEILIQPPTPPSAWLQQPLIFDDAMRERHRRDDNTSTSFGGGGILRRSGSSKSLPASPERRRLLPGTGERHMHRMKANNYKSETNIMEIVTVL